MTANFTGADLAGAQFGDLKSSKLRFSGATLTGASFTSATLTDADFSRALLGRVDFRRTTLTRALFTGATMDAFSDFSDALWIDGTRQCAANSYGSCK